VTEQTSSDTGGEPSDLQLALLWSVVRKHWRLVLAIAGAVTLLVGFLVKGQTKIYQAAMTLKIEPAAIRPLGKEVQTPGESSDYYWTNKEYYETQYKIIQSRKVAEETVRILNLHRDATFVKMLPADAHAELDKELTVEEVAGIVQKRLAVEPVKNSRLVELTFQDADPARAQRVLATLADTYIEQNLEVALTNMGTAGDWLNAQLIKLKAELETSELDLHEYKKKNQLLSVSLDDQSNMLRDEMQQLHRELTSARARREQLAARVSQLNRANPEDPDSLPAAELLNSQVLRELRSNFLKARSERDALDKAGKGANHPEVQSVAATMATARKALLDEVKNIQEAHRRDLLSVDKEVAGLAGLYEAAKQRALDLNLLEIEYNRLARNKENTERMYSLVLERAKQSDVTSQMRFNNISVVDAPLVPQRPVRPRVALSLALGLVGGFALGFGVVLARELLDRRVKIPTDIEQHLQLSCLGLLPQIEDNVTTLPPPGGKQRRRKRRNPTPSGPQELYVHNHPSSGVAEAVRALRTNIVFMSPDEPFKRILVTSAGPSEGKTTVACCLATAIAQSGKSVLLLDADLRRPRLHKVFDVRGSGGVTTALLEPQSLDSAIVPTGVPQLSLLPTGPIAPNPAEMLHSASFQRLLDTLSARFDRIIIDSPPLVPVTDAAILSSMVDATLVVIRAFQTSKDSAKQAVRSLRDVKARIAGAVLNDVDFGRGEYGYYQYYAYKKEGYGSAEAAQ
jgi:capsular exopolysaccharide synthesis family protein